MFFIDCALAFGLRMQAFILHVKENFVFSLKITVEHWALETISFNRRLCDYLKQ